MQTPSLCECLGYKSSELKECVVILHDLYFSRRAASLKILRNKYNRKKVIDYIDFLMFSSVIVNSCYCKLIDLKSLFVTVQICGQFAFSARGANSLLRRSMITCEFKGFFEASQQILRAETIWRWLLYDSSSCHLLIQPTIDKLIHMFLLLTE